MVRLGKASLIWDWNKPGCWVHPPSVNINHLLVLWMQIMYAFHLCWNYYCPNTHRRLGFHFLQLRQQVAVMTLCAGHNQLNAHVSRKMKLAPSPTCSCSVEDQMAEHVQTLYCTKCPLQQTAAWNVWPTAVLLHSRCYGSKGETRRDSHIHFADFVDSQWSNNREDKEIENTSRRRRKEAYSHFDLCSKLEEKPA